MYYNIDSSNLGVFIPFKGVIVASERGLECAQFAVYSVGSASLSTICNNFTNVVYMQPVYLYFTIFYLRVLVNINDMLSLQKYTQSPLTASHLPNYVRSNCVTVCMINLNTPKVDRTIT